MLPRPDSFPVDLPPRHSVLSMPYTLTPGPATGTTLAALKQRRLLGSRFKTSGKVVVPAQDFCPDTGDSQFDFVEAPHTGVLNAFTETAEGLLGLVRIDGSDVDMAHRLVDTSYADLKVGQRVSAVWSDAPDAGYLSLSGFRPDASAPLGKVEPYAGGVEAVKVVPYHLDLHYNHAYGPFFGRLFDEMRTSGRILGVRMPDGDGALLPPREIDDISHRPSGTWVEIKQTGTVLAMSIIYLEFVGQKQPPPYIYAEILLDGARTKLIHNVSGLDMSRAKELVKPGTRVRAVWRVERTGSLDDISHFELLDGEEQH